MLKAAQVCLEELKVEVENVKKEEPKYIIAFSQDTHFCYGANGGGDKILDIMEFPSYRGTLPEGFGIAFQRSHLDKFFTPTEAAEKAMEIVEEYYELASSLAIVKLELWLEQRLAEQQRVVKITLAGLASENAKLYNIPETVH